MHDDRLLALINKLDTSSILFSIKLPIFYKTLKNAYLVLTEKQVFFVDKKIKKVLFNNLFKDIEIEENVNRKTITFYLPEPISDNSQNIKNNNTKKEDKEGKRKIVAHFKKLDLLTSLFLNLNEKISIEQNQSLNNLSDPSIPTISEISTIPNMSSTSNIPNQGDNNLYASVICGNISFLIHSELICLQNLRKLIFQKISEILKIKIDKEHINLKYFDKIKIYMKCRKKYYKILDDVDLKAGAAFSKNKVEIILK